MKYCKTTTSDHPISKKYPRCLIDFNLLIAQEGYFNGPIFIHEEVVLNLDLVEGQYSDEINRKERCQSMDSAFCVLKNDIKKIVLVEYKFNQVDFRGLKLVDMRGKVAGSTEILSSFMPIYYHYYFVVQENLINQAISRFFRMNPKPGSEFVAISIESLKDLFF